MQGCEIMLTCCHIVAKIICSEKVQFIFCSAHKITLNIYHFKKLKTCVSIVSFVLGWLLSILSSGGCSEGAIATSLQRRVHLSDPAVLPLPVWLNLPSLFQITSLVSVAFVLSACVSGWSHVFLPTTVRNAHRQHVRACLLVVSIHTWLSSFNEVHTDPFKHFGLYTLALLDLCWYTYTRGLGVILMSFTLLLGRQEAVACLYEID